MKGVLNKTMGRSLTGMILMAALTTACTKSNLQGLAGSGSGTANDSIVNGMPVTSDAQQPAGFANPVVAIFALMDPKTGMGALCSGTLISPTVVLTAGHCMTGATSTTKIIVSFGVLDWTKERNSTNTITAKSFVVHPNYAAALANKTVNQVDDLALVLLSSPAPASIMPATLATAEPSFASLGSVTTVGYGQADDRNSATADSNGAGVLRYTQFTSDQLEIYSGAGPVNGMIIADASNTSVCHGDSGGPMFSGTAISAQKVIVGVNDLVIPVYTGQQETDYQAAEKTGDMTTFYAKYPDAHICLGINAFVDVAAHNSWITQTQASLLASNEELAVSNPAPAPDASNSGN